MKKDNLLKMSKIYEMYFEKIYENSIHKNKRQMASTYMNNVLNLTSFQGNAN